MPFFSSTLMTPTCAKPLAPPPPNTRAILGFTDGLAGDLIGWVAGEGGEKYGHVIMYIGNGETIESHGGSGKKTGNALLIRKIEPGYGKRLKYIKPL
jgi:hypothetical protein